MKQFLSVTHKKRIQLAYLDFDKQQTYNIPMHQFCQKSGKSASPKICLFIAFLCDNYFILFAKISSATKVENLPFSEKSAEFVLLFNKKGRFET